MNEKQKILIIGHYLPAYKVGGPVVSIVNLIKNLSKEFNFIVISPDRDFGEKKAYNNVEKKKWVEVDGTLVFYLPKNLFTLFILFKEIKKNSNPNSIVYLNSFFNPFFSISVVIAKKLKVLKIDNLIIAPRGELLRNTLAFKKRKKSLYIWIALRLNLYNDVIWHASTENESKEIIEILKVSHKMIRCALNMSNTNSSDFQIEQVTRSLKNDNNNLQIIFLSRISKEKNLKYALNILFNIKANIIFDIYGPIEDEFLWNECLEIIYKMPKNILINYKGLVNRENVKKVFSCYELFFFPTVGENYAHVIAESLSVGTPVLISDNTPWRDLEAEKLGWDINLDTPELFINAINQMASYTNDERFQIRKHIREIAQKRLNNPDILIANKNLFKLPFFTTTKI